MGGVSAKYVAQIIFRGLGVVGNVFATKENLKSGGIEVGGLLSPLLQPVGIREYITIPAIEGGAPPGVKIIETCGGCPHIARRTYRGYKGGFLALHYADGGGGVEAQ